MRKHAGLSRFLIVAICGGATLVGSQSAAAKDKQESIPQWGLDAAKTPTPDYAKNSGSVILYDEYLETIDAQGARSRAQARSLSYS